MRKWGWYISVHQNLNATLESAVLNPTVSSTRAREVATNNGYKGMHQTSIMNWKSTPVSLMLCTPYKDDICLLSCNILRICREFQCCLPNFRQKEGQLILLKQRRHCNKPWKLLHHYHAKLWKTHCQSVQIWPYKATGIASPLQILWCPHCVSMVCTNSTEVK